MKREYEKKYEQICIGCGKPYMSAYKRGGYCSGECYDTTRSIRYDYKQAKFLRAFKKEQEKSEKVIIDVNAKAKALGLSYGMYVAKYMNKN